MWDKRTGLRVMYLCRVGGAHTMFSVHTGYYPVGWVPWVGGSLVGIVGIVGSLVGIVGSGYSQ